MERIELESVKNIRDLGGTRAADGHTVVPRRLIRSARLSELNAHDAQALVGVYDVHTVIDLRTETERQENPDIVPEGVDYLVAPLVKEHTLGIVHDRQAAERMREGIGLPDIREIYQRIILEPEVDAWHAIFDTFRTNAAGAVLWHCTGGKDRCGLVAYMVETLLDIPAEMRMEDYLITNEDAQPRADRAYESVMRDRGDALLAEKVRDIFRADETYLVAAVQAIEQCYGSTEGFLEQVCGLDAHARDEMRVRYLE